MLFSDITSDILEIKNAVNDDTDLEEMWILHKFFTYRAVHIAFEFALTNQINPAWLQRHPKIDIARCTAADDPSVLYSSVQVGKASIPTVVSLPDNLGLYRLSGSSGIINLEPCDFGRMMMKASINEERAPASGYYSQIDNKVYVWPYVPYISAILIAANPLEIPYNDNGTIRDLTLEDQCPVDQMIAQKAIIDFLTKDLAIKEGTIADITNDSQSELNIMRGYNGKRND